MKHSISILLIWTGLSIISGQDNSIDSTEAYSPFLQTKGYVIVESDSANTPIFINGVYIGKTPIKEPVPIENGIHEISYLPPNFEIPSIKDRLPEAVKRVYIPANDTITVSLIYDIHRSEFKRIRQEQTVTYISGFTITCMILYLLWMI